MPTLILPEAVTITRNTGRLTSKGLELELKALLFPGLEFSYNFGYTDAEYRSLQLSGDEGEQDLEGNKQIFTPETNSMLSLQYKRNFGKQKGVQGFIRGEWKHLGKQYFDLQNNLVQDPYHLFNAHFGINYREWQITFWGRDISDTRYVSYGYNFGAVRLGNTVTYGVTLSAQIGS